MANGIFDAVAFAETNFNLPTVTLSKTSPQAVAEQQKLQDLRDLGRQDAAAEDQGLETSGFQPQNMAEHTAYVEGRASYVSDANTHRTFDQALGDSLLSVGAGIVNSLGSMAGVAEGFQEGMLNPNATIGETVSRNLSGVQKLTDYLTDMQSDELKARQRAQAMRSDLQEQADQAQYEKDLANGMGSFQAGIRDFGRDVRRYASTQDASTLADSTMQGVGSIFGPGLGAKLGAFAVTKFATKFGTGQLGRKATTTGAKSALKETGEKAVENTNKKGIFNIPTKWKDASIMGYGEATGNMLGTNAEALNTPIEDLRQVPRFNELVGEYLAQGYDQVSAEEQARVALAGEASLRTGAYSLPSAIMAGRLATWAMHPFSKLGSKGATGVSDDVATKTAQNTVTAGANPVDDATAKMANKAEGVATEPVKANTGSVGRSTVANVADNSNPTNLANSLSNWGKTKAIAGNMKDESMEEGLQGIFGTTAGNLSAQQTYDPNRGIFDDAGYSMAEGATTGALSAGAIRSPQLLRTGLSGSVNAISSAKNSLKSSPERNIRKANKVMQESPAMQDIRVKATQNVTQPEPGVTNVADVANTTDNATIDTADNVAENNTENNSVAQDLLKSTLGVNSSLYSGLSDEEADTVFGQDQKAKDMAKTHNNKLDIAYGLATLMQEDKDADGITQLRRGLVLNNLLETVGNNTTAESENYDPDFVDNFTRNRAKDKVSPDEIDNKIGEVLQDPNISKVFSDAQSIIHNTSPEVKQQFIRSTIENAKKTAQESPQIKSDAWASMSLALNDDALSQNTEDLKDLISIANKYGWGDVERSLNSVLKTKAILEDYKSRLTKLDEASAKQRFSKSRKAVRDNLLLVNSDTRRSVRSFIQSFYTHASNGHFIDAAKTLVELKKLAISQRNKAEAMEEYNKVNQYDASSGKVLNEKPKDVSWNQLNSKNRKFQTSVISGKTRKVSPIALYDEADTLDAICDNLQHIIPEEFQLFNNDIAIRDFYKINQAQTKYDPARFNNADQDTDVSSGVSDLLDKNNPNNVNRNSNNNASAGSNANNNNSNSNAQQQSQQQGNQQNTQSQSGQAQQNANSTGSENKTPEPKGKANTTEPTSVNNKQESVDATTPNTPTTANDSDTNNKSVDTKATVTKNAETKADTVVKDSEPVGNDVPKNIIKVVTDTDEQSFANAFYSERMELSEPAEENKESFENTVNFIKKFYSAQHEKLNKLFKAKSETYNYSANPVDDLLAKVSGSEVDPNLKPYAEDLKKAFSKDDPNSFYSRFSEALLKAVANQLAGHSNGKSKNPLINEDETLNLDNVLTYLHYQSGGLLYLLDISVDSNNRVKPKLNNHVRQLMALTAYSFMQNIPLTSFQLNELAKNSVEDEQAYIDSPDGSIESFTAQQLLDSTIAHYFNLKVDKNAPMNSVLPIQAVINNTIRIALNNTPTVVKGTEPVLTITKVRTVTSDEINNTVKPKDNYYFSVEPKVLDTFKVPAETIDDFLNVQDKKSFVIDEAVTDIPNTARNSDLPLIEPQKKFLKEVNNLDNRVDPKMALLYTDLATEDNINRLKGQYYDKKQLNSMTPQQRASVSGRSLGDSLAYKRFTAIMNSLKAIKEAYANGADKIQKKLSDLPIHFKFGITKVNRIQGDGFDPVSNKLLREVFLPTVDTLDVSGIFNLVQGNNPNAVNNLADPAKFMVIALGQAFGMKIHKNHLTDISSFVLEKFNKFEQILKNDNPVAYQYLLDLQKRSKDFNETGNHTAYTQNGKAVSMANISSAIFKAQVDAGIDSTRLATHALVEMMSWKSATPAELKAWDTTVYLETDGITNGVCNSTLLFNDKVDDASLDILSRCGIQLGRSISYCDHIIEQKAGNSPERADDTYEAVVRNLKESLPKRIKTLIGNPGGEPNDNVRKIIRENKTQIISALGFVSLLNPNLNKSNAFSDLFTNELLMSTPAEVQNQMIQGFLGSGLEFSRNFTKGPTTQANYNAGTRTISRTVLDTTMLGLNELLTKALQAIQQNPNIPWYEALGFHSPVEFRNFQDIIINLFNNYLDTDYDPEEQRLRVITRNNVPGTNGDYITNPITRILNLPPDASRISALQNLESIPAGSIYYENALANIQNTFGKPLNSAIEDTVAEEVNNSFKYVVEASNYIAKVLNAINTKLWDQYKEELYEQHTKLTQEDEKYISEGKNENEQKLRRIEKTKEKLISQGMLATLSAQSYIPTRAEKEKFGEYVKKHGSALNRFNFKYSTIINEKSKTVAGKKINSYNKSVGNTLSTYNSKGQTVNIKANASCFQYAPTENKFIEPGVSLAPNTTISQGDGAMMQELFNSWDTLVGEDIPKNVLDVFDGLHVRMSDASKIIKGVNTAQFDTATSNPIQSIVDFTDKTDFLKITENLLKGLVQENPGLAQELLVDLKIFPEDHVFRDIENDTKLALIRIEVIFAKLKERALNITATQEAIKALPSTLGQMGNGDIAGVTQTTTNENIAKYMLGNTEYDRTFIKVFLGYYSNKVLEHLSKGNQGLPKDILDFDTFYSKYYYSDSNSIKQLDLVDNAQDILEHPGVSGITITTLNNSNWSLDNLVDKSIEEYDASNPGINSEGNTSAQGLKLLKPFLKASFSKRLGNVPIVVGTRAKLQQYAKSKNIPLPQAFVDTNSKAEAVTLSGPGIIFIVSDAKSFKASKPKGQEITAKNLSDSHKVRITLLHELIHIGTSRLLQDYATNPDSYKGTQEEAVIKNLQTLMNFFEQKLYPKFKDPIERKLQALKNSGDTSSATYLELKNILVNFNGLIKILQTSVPGDINRIKALNEFIAYMSTNFAFTLDKNTGAYTGILRNTNIDTETKDTLTERLTKVFGKYIAKVKNAIVRLFFGDKFANNVFAKNNVDTDNISDKFLDNVIYHTGLLMGAQLRASDNIFNRENTSVLTNANSDRELISEAQASEDANNSFYNDLNLDFNTITGETYDIPSRIKVLEHFYRTPAHLENVAVAIKAKERADSAIDDLLLDDLKDQSTDAKAEEKTPEPQAEPLPIKKINLTAKHKTIVNEAYNSMSTEQIPDIQGEVKSSVKLARAVKYMTQKEATFFIWFWKSSNKQDNPEYKEVYDAIAKKLTQRFKEQDTALKQDNKEPVNLSEAFSEMFSPDEDNINFLNRKTRENDVKNLAYKAQSKAIDLLDKLNSYNLLRTHDQQETFIKLASLVQGSSNLKIGSLSQLQQVYEQVQASISADAFKDLGLTVDQVNTYISLLNGSAFINNNNLKEFTHKSALANPMLVTFVGLSQLDDNVKQALQNIGIKIKTADGTENYDSVFNKWLSSVGNGLSNFVLGSYQLNNKNKNAQAYASTLIQQLKNPKNRSDFVQNSLNVSSKITNQINTGCVHVIDTIADAGANVCGHLADKTSVKTISTLLKTVESVLLAYNTNNSEYLLKTISAQNVWNPVKDLMKDIVGRNTVTNSFYTINKQVKSMVQGVRERCSKVIPSHFDSIFTSQLKRQLTKEEHKALYKVYGKLDLTALGNFSLVKTMLDTKTRKTKINDLEKSIYTTLSNYYQQTNSNYAKDKFRFIRNKSKQLARYLNTGIPGDCLLKNPYAILNAEGILADLSKKDSSIIKDIDQLISLYALDSTEPETLKTFENLIQNAPLASQGIFNFLKELRNNITDSYVNNALFTEDGDARNVAQLFNYRKGYLPPIYQDSSSIVLDEVTPAKINYYKSKGYEPKQSAIKHGDKTLGYFYRSFDPTSTYNQGALQIIHSYGLGVNNVTGGIVSPVSYKTIEPTEARRIYRNKRDFFSKAKENYAPIFNSEGEIIGMEILPDTKVLELKPTSENLLTAVGTMYSRNQEQKLAIVFNQQIIDNLVDMYDKASSTEKSTLFENILGSSDSVIQDSVNQLPKELKDALVDAFASRGYKGICIRRDLLNDVLGERQASLTDPFMGVSRLSPKTQKIFIDTATKILGDKALKYLTYADKNIKNLASIARNTIVIKSIQVAYSNIISNGVFLAMSGISPAFIYKKSLQAYRELEWYNKTQKEITKLYTIYHSLDENSPEREKILARISTREEHKKQLSIYPLLVSGEYNTIADIGTQYSDKPLELGKFGEYLEFHIKKLPPSVRTLTSNVFLTQDSPIYQGLQKATQYGDFIAKAVLYQHLLDKGVSVHDAHVQVADAFVDYDRQRGRWRGGLEDFGLLWFWNFKLRSTKQALYLMKYHPIASLLYAVSPVDMSVGKLIGADIGSPLGDNVVSSLAQGNFATMGPGMYSNIVTANPWVSLMY